MREAWREGQGAKRQGEPAGIGLTKTARQRKG